MLNFCLLVLSFRSQKIQCTLRGSSKTFFSCRMTFFFAKGGTPAENRQRKLKNIFKLRMKRPGNRHGQAARASKALTRTAPLLGLSRLRPGKLSEKLARTDTACPQHQLARPVLRQGLFCLRRTQSVRCRGGLLSGRTRSVEHFLNFFDDNSSLKLNFQLKFWSTPHFPPGIIFEIFHPVVIIGM